jgi:hypothetical protein
MKAKVSKKRVTAHWKVICDHVDGAKGLPDPQKDDELDCLVAWLLARNWIAGNEVIQLGNQQTGSFLVPDVSGLNDEFECFLKAKKIVSAMSKGTT